MFRGRVSTIGEEDREKGTNVESRERGKESTEGGDGGTEAGMSKGGMRRTRGQALYHLGRPVLVGRIHMATDGRRKRRGRKKLRDEGIDTACSAE